MAVSFNSVLGFNSTVALEQLVSQDKMALSWYPKPITHCEMDKFVAHRGVISLEYRTTAKYQNVSKVSVGASIPAAATQFTFFFGTFGQRRRISEKRWGICLSVADSNQLTTGTGDKASETTASSPDDRLPAVDSTSSAQFQKSVIDQSGPQTSESPNGTLDSSNLKEASLSPGVQPKSKRTPLTARERLRAAKVLSRYTDSKPSKKSARGKNVLDALRDSERGKKRSGLPEAPTNIFDDSKRGMPKQGLTWDFPGGNDLFLILFSFVFISTVMFATTYVVWKLGAIHFNEN